MKNISLYWKMIKFQPDIWFFYTFLLVSFFSIRKVIFFFPIAGNFNEYSGIYIYLSDILLLLTLTVWIIFILHNKYYKVSIKCSHGVCLHRGLFHVEHLKKDMGIFRTHPYLILPLILVFWSIISIIWSENYFISAFRSFKIFEFSLLFIYLFSKIFVLNNREISSSNKNVSRGTLGRLNEFNIFPLSYFLRNILRIFIFVGVLNAIIAIVQFLLQESIGLFFLRESLISPYISGVAKIIINGNKYIRSYGLFPHPNILGGFLMVSTIFTIFYEKMCLSVCEIPKRMKKMSGIERFYELTREPISWKFALILFIQLLALFLTFSKAAIIGLIIALIFIFGKIGVSRETLYQVRKTSKFSKQNELVSFLIILLVLSFFVYTLIDNNSFILKSIEERLFYIDVSHETILLNPIIGLGSGQFVLNLENIKATEIEDWQYQPVHNIFLLIWSELGIVGLSIFIYFIWTLLIRKPDVSRETLNNNSGAKQFLVFVLMKGIFIGFLFIMLFDHYFWDIQQGSIIFWVVLGVIAGTLTTVSKEKTALTRSS